MANRPSRLVIPVQSRSYDNLFHGRYPGGNAPQILSAAAVGSAAAAGTLKVGAGLFAATIASLLAGASLTTGGGAAPGAPSSVMMILQGQTATNSGTLTGSNDFIPQNANSLTITWVQGAPGNNSISQNKIYRSVNGGGYTLYATITAATSYTDTAATACVGYPVGSGPDFYSGNGYCYQVTAVDTANNESPRSASMVAPYVLNGAGILTGGDFNGPDCTTTYNNATGPMMAGRTANVKMHINTAFGIWLPWAGNGATEWNLNIRAFNYFNIWVAAGQAASALQFAPVRVGDQPIRNSGGGQLTIPSSTYAALVSGTYVLIKIPLNVMMLDYTNSPVSGSQQHAFYKTNVQTTKGSGGEDFYVGDMFFSEA